MTEFVSDIKTIPNSDSEIFNVLSDLSRVESLKEKVPADKLGPIKDWSCDSDSCTITVDPVGKIKFLIV